MFFGSIHIRNAIVTVSMSFFLAMGCTTEEKFPDIGRGFAGPADVASINEFSFVLNSDFDRKYNTGSIVTLNPSLGTEAEKVATHKVPRMGRSLFSRGQFLIATFDRTELGSMGTVEIYSVSATGVLTTAFEQEIDCSPISAKISQSQNWAAISCISGEVYISPFNASSVASTDFKFVRNYKYAHRALFFYESDGDDYLLAFPTDMGEQSSGDLSSTDAVTYMGTSSGESGTELEFEQVPNEVPDLMESSLSALFQFSARYPYQMAILNLTQSQQNGFLFKELGSISKQDEVIEVVVNGVAKQVYEYANHELKFVYFKLETTAGETPDVGNSNSGTSEDTIASQKYYRTNFWDVQEIDSKSFYLAHRGIGRNGSTNANNILEFKINDSGNDSSVFAGPSSATPAPFSNKFAEMFTLENRIYGSSVSAASGYVGDFEVVTLNSGAKVAFVNQFRDEAYWDSSYRLYAIDAQKLGGPFEDSEPTRWLGLDFSQSAYQIAITRDSSGYPTHLVSCSFYGDSVLVFDIDEINGIDSSAGPRSVF